MPVKYLSDKMNVLKLACEMDFSDIEGVVSTQDSDQIFENEQKVKCIPVVG